MNRVDPSGMLFGDGHLLPTLEDLERIANKQPTSGFPGLNAYGTYKQTGVIPGPTGFSGYLYAGSGGQSGSSWITATQRQIVVKEVTVVKKVGPDNISELGMFRRYVENNGRTNYTGAVNGNGKLDLGWMNNWNSWGEQCAFSPSFKGGGGCGLHIDPPGPIDTYVDWNGWHDFHVVYEEGQGFRPDNPKWHKHGWKTTGLLGGSIILGPVGFVVTAGGIFYSWSKTPGYETADESCKN